MEVEIRDRHLQNSLLSRKVDAAGTGRDVDWRFCVGLDKLVIEFLEKLNGFSNAMLKVI